MINKVILVGNVGRDPEIRHLDNNLIVARFSLATSESYKNKNGERITNTEWHNIVVWRGLAEIAEKYVKKGSLIAVEGKIRNRTWDDKEGNKRYSIEIDCDNLQLLGRKQDDGSHLENHSGRETGIATEPMDIGEISPTDDLPF
ncbi:MAG: single-stranded DNA-binding protein [Bacteroidales bacterium]|nr:single-stranded DNA-binding protein [Bacteroidales bacterium]